MGTVEGKWGQKKVKERAVKGIKEKKAKKGYPNLLPIDDTGSETV